MTKSLLFLRIAAISTGIAIATFTVCAFGYWWFSHSKSWNKKAVIAKFHDVEVDDQSDPGSLTFRYVLVNQTSEDYLLPSPQTGNLMKLNPKDQALDPLTKAEWPSDTIIPAKQSVIIAFKMPCGDVFDWMADPNIVSCYLNDPYTEFGGFEEMPDRTSKSPAKDEWDQYAVPANPTSPAGRTRTGDDPFEKYGGAAVEAPPVPDTQPPVSEKQDEEQTKEDIINATIGGLVFFDYLHRYEIVFPNGWKHSPTSR